MTRTLIVIWSRRLLWVLVGCLLVVPLGLAIVSPLQAGREPAYVIGALAGVLALSLLFLQPLLAAGFLSGIKLARGRRWHRHVGVLLVSAVAVHILGLYLASPDDMRDALLLVAPTPFSLYGVIALWAVVLTSLSAMIRLRTRLSVSTWNRLHSVLAAIVVSASVAHAWMIDGTMNGLSKMIACMGIAVVTLMAIVYLQWIKPSSRIRQALNNPD